MKKRKNLILFGILVLLSASYLVSAEIFFSQPNEIYNSGDGLNVTVRLQPNTDTNDFSKVKLVCVSVVKPGDNNFTNSTNSTGSNQNYTQVNITGNVKISQVEVYKSPISLKAGESKNVVIDAKLNSFLIGDLEGICYLLASYGTDESSSQNFEITRRVNVNLDFEKILFDPGEIINVSGGAVKENGRNLNGFIEIGVNELGLKVTGEVVNGSFNIPFELPKTIRSGEHVIYGWAYDRDNAGIIINQGNITEEIKIRQIVSSVDIKFNGTRIVPGNSLTFSPVVYDQAMDEMSQEVSVRIFNPEGESVYERVHKSGKDSSFEIKTNDMPGEWSVLVKMDDFEKSRPFYVDELEKALFILGNGTLSIENTGNVPYTKPVEVILGNITQVRDLYVDVGESKEIPLKAPEEGEYEIRVNEGGESLTLGRTFISGNAISLGNFGAILTGPVSFIIWAIIILIALVIAVYFYRKIRKKAYVGRKKNFIKNPFKKKEGESVNKVSQPSQTIGDGTREEAEVISVRIKNLEDLQKSGKKEEASAFLRDVLMNIKRRRAKIYVSGDDRLIILSKAITGEKENSLSSLILAKEIKEKVDGYNKTHTQKVNYGIGIHHGELAIERVEGDIKYTSLGNTINLAKKLSGESKGEILISDVLHGKVLGKVKSQKGSNGMYWVVNQVPDRIKHDDFVKKFLERQKKS